MRRKPWTRRLWRVSSVKNERKALKSKSILLGITGGVAAYKSIDLIRRLREKDASVTVIMTEASKYFVTPLSLQAASNNTVFADLFSSPMAHITLPSQADIMVIAPATANIIGKFATGIADDLLSTCLLSYNGKIIIAPSMNWRMYENPVLQKNLGLLLSRGVIQVGPEKGPLACGEEGTGRMSEIADIIEAIESAFATKDLFQEKIVVTAGPTREYIDPVRFFSNRSSGKMGYALARAALRRGAEVTLISGPSELSPPKGAHFIPVQTAEDMLRAAGEQSRCATVLIMSAAVADFKPIETAKEKIEKPEKLHLTLVRTPDIVSEIGRKKSKPFIIGFAAETGVKIEKARKKLKEKNMDMIIFNNVTEEGSGFDVETNKVIILDKKKEKSLPLLSKDSVADAILDRMIEIKT
jgi:phosphopantothenoylcysteine decarboxylase / phosphopantothenate---cysteine ligase